jgi:hypothetical protein
MEFVVIFGPPAVGKMTVGLELEKLTGYKLFHNHVTFELVYNFFDVKNPSFWQLVREFRNRIFEEMSKSDIKGLIFTYVWALDQESDRAQIENYCKRLNKNIDEVIFVELYADQKTRLNRNKSELRLKIKKSKNNFEQSETSLIECDEKYKLNSNNDFEFPKNHLKFDNTNLKPNEVAKVIYDKIM